MRPGCRETLGGGPDLTLLCVCEVCVSAGRFSCQLLAQAFRSRRLQLTKDNCGVSVEMSGEGFWCF